MGTHMKTTVELGDALLAEARQVAAAEGTTLRALLEEGLRAALHRRHQPRAFQLRDAAFAGEGLQDAFKENEWAKIRAAIYEDRGT